MPFAIKTDPMLVARIEQAAKTPSTKQEAHQARVSFVFGNLPQKTTLDRPQVEAIIAKIDG
jgi:hypothetical protein